MTEYDFRKYFNFEQIYPQIRLAFPSIPQDKLPKDEGLFEKTLHLFQKVLSNISMIIFVVLSTSCQRTDSWKKRLPEWQSLAGIPSNESAIRSAISYGGDVK